MQRKPIQHNAHMAGSMWVSSCARARVCVVGASSMSTELTKCHVEFHMPGFMLRIVCDARAHAGAIACAPMGASAQREAHCCTSARKATCVRLPHWNPNEIHLCHREHYTNIMFVLSTIGILIMIRTTCPVQERGAQHAE